MSQLRVMPLGGLGEVGMNCLALEQDGEVLVVDCGVSFDDRGVGVDVVHPDFSALEQFRVAGLVITHGHEDHIGAVPYFLKQFDVPVFAPPYAMGLIRERAREHEVLRHARITATTPRMPYNVGSFRVEHVRVTHSIADATSVVIDTRAGKVIHTGDFKIDPTPPDGEQFDAERFEQLGDEGVALLMSDSTNIDARGEPGSEASVGDVLNELVSDAKGAVVVAMFASNVHRLRMLGEVAKRTGRRIVILGRSVFLHSRVATSSGYLNWPADLVFPAERIGELPRNKILAIATGTQAEQNAAMARLARKEHPHFELDVSDRIIFSSRVIPGHDPVVYSMIGKLLRLGVEVRTWVTDRGVHVSGHAYRSEQQRMIELVRPNSFLPLHGMRHQLDRHAALARELGIRNVVVAEDGDRIDVTAESVALGERFHAGQVCVFAGREVLPETVKERQQIAREGVVFVWLGLAGNAGETVSVDAVGVATGELGEHFLAEAEREARNVVRHERKRGSDSTWIAEQVRLVIRRAAFRAVGFKPDVHVRYID